MEEWQKMKEIGWILDILSQIQFGMTASFFCNEPGNKSDVMQGTPLLCWCEVVSIYAC